MQNWQKFDSTGADTLAKEIKFLISFCNYTYSNIQYNIQFKMKISRLKVL